MCSVVYTSLAACRLGEMMDQPRHVRIQALEAERKKKIEQEKTRQEKLERERQNMEKMAALRHELGHIYEAIVPFMVELSREEGEYTCTCTRTRT